MMSDQLVLVVEDDPHFGRQLIDLFEFLGYRVELATSGTEGVERFEALDVDFLLTDLMLPGMSGVEVVKCVRGLSGGEDLPVMMMSAIYKNPRLFEKELRDLDILEFVAKPFSLIDLGRKVDAVLHDSLELDADDAHITNTGSWRIEDIDDALGDSQRTLEPLGSFDRKALFALIVDLFRGHAAGRLILTHQRSRRELYFLNGYPVWATSDEPDESAEAILVKLGALQARLLPELHVHALRDGCSVTDAAVQGGHCTGDQLLLAERQRVRAIVVGAFKWASGEYEWVPGDDFIDRVAVHETNPVPCLAEAVTRFMAVDELAPDLQHRSDQVFVEGTRRRRLGSYLVLPPELLGLNDAFDDPVTVGALFQTYAAHSDLLIRFLWLMFRLGIADSVDAAPASPDLLRPSASSGEQSMPPAPAFLPAADELATTETVRMPQEGSEAILTDYLSLMSADHYRFLRVDPRAELAAIEVAYQALQPRYDVYALNLAGDVRRKAKELRGRLELAFDTLNDARRRAAYDAELAQRAVEKARSRPGAAERLRSARSLLDGGDYPAAAGLLRELATSHPNSAEVLCLLGRCEARSEGGDVSAGRDHLKRALSIDPFHARSLRYLAELEGRVGDVAARQAAVEALRALDPDDPWLILHPE